MSILEAILLGIIQGLSEFIPISSTAHLTIAGDLLGLIDPNDPHKWTAFIAVIQIGTMGAVLAYFRKEIRHVPISWMKENIGKNRLNYSKQSDFSRLGWLIIIGSIPIVIVGLAFKDIIEGNLTKDPIVIASSLIILAVILYIADKTARFKKNINDLNWKDSLIVGFGQCLALIPGASRSGTTITTGLFLGMNRETAARFSFLLSIPAVLGSGLLEFYQSLEYLTNDDLLTIIVATIVSGISGYYAIAFLINFLKSRSTLLFVVYRIALGLLILFLVNQGIM
jgi:undecaprenyl-diphosphatase